MATKSFWTAAALCLGAWLAPGASAQSADPAESAITIAVSPPKFELNLGDGPVNDSLKIFNFGKEPSEIQVSVHNWELDELNQVTIVEPDEQSLDQWVVINPVRFTVPAGGSQTVRFSVRPKVQPSSGEHRAIIYLQQVPKNDFVSKSNMQVVGRIGVAVYGYVGDIQRQGEVNRVQVDVSRDNPLALFDISSFGSAHVRMRGHYTVWPAGTYPGSDATPPLDATTAEQLIKPEGALEIGFLPNLPILPDSRRTLPLWVQSRLAPGNYVLDVEGLLSGKPVSIGIPFAVSADNIAQGESN